MTTKFWIAAGLVAVLSYLLGSLSFAVIVSRVHAKDDVRRHGSGNAGMTNILRTYGTGPAVLTALGDFGKALVAVLLARLIFYLAGFTRGETQMDAGYIAGLFVLLGHLFPLYFHFKGGKGVMTSLGVILVVNPLVFLILAVLFIPLVFITRIVSLGSILGAIVYPVFTWITLSLQGQSYVFETVCAAVTGIIVLVMHRENIGRLLKGTENRFEKKKK